MALEVTRDDLDKIIKLVESIEKRIDTSNSKLGEISAATAGVHAAVAQNDRLYKLLQQIQTNVAPENENETSRMAVYLGKLVRKAGA
jgi:hypothetical protein